MTNMIIIEKGNKYKVRKQKIYDFILVPVMNLLYYTLSMNCKYSRLYDKYGLPQNQTLNLMAGIIQVNEQD